MTSQGDDLSIFQFSASAGSIVARPENAPSSTGGFEFSYAAWGGGVSIDGLDAGFDYSTYSMYSAGKIYSLSTRPLNRSDFQGGCVIFSAGVAGVTGVSGGVFLFGAPAALTLGVVATDNSTASMVLGPAFAPAAIAGAVANHFLEQAFWRSFKGFAAIIGENRGISLPGVSMLRGVLH